MKGAFFDPAISELMEYAKKKEQQLRGAEPGTDKYRRWMLYRTLIKGIIEYGSGVLDRNDLNTALLVLYTEGGKQGELVSAAYQMQFLQAAERALIHRKLTPPRALAHLLVRYKSHADEVGGIFAYLRNQIDELEQTIGYTTNTPEP